MRHPGVVALLEVRVRVRVRVRGEGYPNHVVALLETLTLLLALPTLTLTQVI